MVNEENGDLKDEIEEIYRVGKHKEDSHRPLRMKSKSQKYADTARAKAWKLNRNEETKNIYIRRDLN